MTRRTRIIDALKDSLESIPSIEQVFKSYRYLDEINDFPSITFVARGEIRDHRGDGAKLATIQVDCRVYQYDRDISTLDLLVREIEDQIDTFAASQRVNGVEIAQVVTVGGDEGLMRPYQVGDLQILITYEVDV